MCAVSVLFAVDPNNVSGHQVEGYTIVLFFIILITMGCSFLACCERFEIVRKHADQRTKSHYIVLALSFTSFMVPFSGFLLVLAQGFG